jgi:hypothetical protein
MYFNASFKNDVIICFVLYEEKEVMLVGKSAIPF